MEYYLALKKEWYSDTTWMNLEDIMLSEINQTKKTKQIQTQNPVYELLIWSN